MFILSTIIVLSYTSRSYNFLSLESRLFRFYSVSTITLLLLSYTAFINTYV